MFQSHLLLDELDLAPSNEWEPPGACWRIVRVASGQGYWLGTGEAREINAGKIIVIAPQQRGTFRASQLGTMRLQHFRFCPELMGGLLTVTERSHFERLAAKAQPTPRLFPEQHPAATLFASVVGQASARTSLLQRCRLLELVGTIFERELTRAGTPQRPTLSASKRIKVLMQHLTVEEFLSASAEALAAYCGCSLRHFSRLFLQTFGVSLRARQTELRLLKAKRLLAETELRVVTVATNCGYRHLGVFNSLFRKRFGMTPTEWRRRAAGQKDCSPFCEAAGVELGEIKPGTGDSNGAVVTET
jgi:AraC-like DNA-binding protein